MKKAALFFLAMVFSIVLSAQIRMNAWVMPDTSTNFPMNVPIYTLVWVESDSTLYSVKADYLSTDNMHDVITDGEYQRYYQMATAAAGKAYFVVSDGIGDQPFLMDTTGWRGEEGLPYYLALTQKCLRTIPITPATAAYAGLNSFGTSIVENSKYIFITFTLYGTGADEYKDHYVCRYNKHTHAVAGKTITTTNGYYEDSHKLPTMLITSNDVLLVAIEELPGNNNHNSPVDVFRWTDLDDLDTYTVETVGNATTERLSYPYLHEIGGNVILEARRYSTQPSWRYYYVSTDDGDTFGAANTWIDYSADTDYWMYSNKVSGNPRDGSYVIRMITPQNDNSNANCYQYATFIKCDFSGDFLALDGTNLGATVDDTELETHVSWGDITKNTSLYYVAHATIHDGFIYALGLVGTRTSVATDITDLQLFKVEVDGGTVTTGAAMSNAGGAYIPTTLIDSYYYCFFIGGDLYIKISPSNDGKLLYYKADSTLNSMTLIHTEDSDYSNILLYSETDGINADYDEVNKVIRVFDSDPADDGETDVINMLRQRSTWHAYGGFQDSAVTVTLTNQSTWYHITNANNDLWTAVETDGMTLVGDTITITNGADYTGQLSLTFSGINGRDFQIWVWNITDGVAATYHVGATTTSASNFTNVTLPIYLEATAGDQFRMEMQCTSTAGATPVVKSAVFNIQYLHD